MPYVESDFILALIKEKDWLKDNAMRAYHKYNGTLWTSGYCIAEVLLISEEYELDQEKIVSNIYQIIQVKGLDEKTAILIAHYMKHKKMTTFDAFHAAHSRSDKILSSDKKYDEVELERIRLEDE